MKKTMTVDSTDSYKKLKRTFSFLSVVDNRLKFKKEIKSLMMILFLCLGFAGYGQMEIPSTTPVVENFNLMSSNTSNALPASWRIHSNSSPVFSSGTRNLGQQAVPGTPTAGATYNWGSTTTERSPGVMTSGSFSSPSSLMGQYKNTNTVAITKVSVDFSVERYRRNTANASVQFFYSTNGSSWTPVTAGDVSTTELPTGSSIYGTPQLTVNKSNVGVTFPTPIAKDGIFYLRWNLNTTGGNSQGIGIDDVSVTATFASSTYTVTYNGNGSDGGTAPVDNNEYEEEDEVTVLPNTFTYAGYNFTGWNTQANGLGTPYDVDDTFEIPAHNVVLYAQWEASSAPYITPSGTLSALSTTYGTASTNTIFTLDAGNLTNDLIITAPAGFHVSENAGSGFASSINLGSGNQSGKTIYVRLAATIAAGNYSGNISLESTGVTTATITTASSTVNPKVLAITGLSAVGKTYDGNTNVTVNGTPAYDGLVNAESFSVTGSVTWTFPDKIAGNNKTLTRTGSYDAPSANYTVTQPVLTATISKKDLIITGATAQNKIYNGNTTAVITGATPSMADLISGDVVTVSGGGTFADANVAEDIEVEANLTLGGIDAGNYNIIQPTGLKANITKATLTATAENKSKAEGAVNPTLTIAYTGFISGQNAGNAAGFTAPSISTTAVQASPAGTYPITLSGGSADNYSFTLVNGTLTVNAIYNGTGVFEKITALNQLEDGYYVMVGNGTNAMNTDNSTTANKLGRTTVTVTDNKITNPAKSIVWKVETVSGNIKTIYNEDVEKFVSSNGSNTNITLVSSVTGNKEKWTASSSIQTSINAFRFTSDEQTTRGLVYSGTPGISAANVFGQYATSNVNANFTQSGNVTYYDLALYKLVPPVPALSVSTEEITGLNYLENDGPSAPQSFTVSGENLNGSNVTVLADGTKFEISEDEEGDINGDYTNEITLTAYNGANKTIWVRLKAGQSVGLKGDVVLISGGGATDVQIVLSGEVTSSAPSLSVDTEEIEDLGYTFGASVSAPKIFKLSGLNLDGTKDVLLGLDEGAGSNFEISLSENSGYDSELLIGGYDGTPTDIYVRLKTGRTVADDYMDIIEIITDYNNITLNVLVSGAVTAPVITTNPDTAVPAMTAVAGETDSEDVAVSGTLTANVTAEIIGTNANQFSVNPASVTSAGGNITVTYQPTTAGNHTATLKLSTNGNVTKELALTGTATLATPTATDATNITSNSFTANWNPVTGAESYELDVYTKATGGNESDVEDFSGIVINGNFIGEGSTFNEGWSFLSDGSRQQYTSTNNYGNSAPSFAFTATGDYIQTAVYPSSVQSFSFWAKQQAGTTSSTLIEGFNGTGWVTIATLANNDSAISGTTGGTKTYDLVNLEIDNITQVRMVFTKVAGNLSVDDVTVNYIGDTPITGSPFTGVTTTSHTVANLEPETEYYYKARAVSGDVTSDDSNEIKAETLPVITWSTDNLWLNDRQPNIEEDVIIKGALVINGDTGKNSFAARTLTVNSGGSLTINADKAVTVENGIVNNGTITVESDGNLIQTNDAATNTGNITVKRIAKMKRQDYTYWSSPVSGQNLKLFSPNTLNNRFYTYNEADNGFIGINPVTNVFGNNSSGEFESAAKGYAIRAYNTYPTNGAVQTFTGTFTGIPNNGNKSFSLKKTGDGFNLVGNPYPSNIDFAELYSNNSSVITNAAYFWTNTNVYSEGDYIANNYAQYVNGEGNPAANLDPNEENTPTNIIKPGQGFLVEALGNGTLNFSNSIRTSYTKGVFFNSKSGLKDRYWLKLSTPLNNFNTIAVVYKEGATNNYDRNYDGALMIIGSDSFYSLSDNQKLAIQGRAYPLVDSDVVPLGAVFYQTGNHTISISKKEGVFDNGQNIYLKDKETGILTNLSQGSYTFTANKGESTGRFEIVYQSATLSTNTQQKDDLYVYRDGNNFVIKSEYKKITGLEVYDLSGRLVYATKSNSTEVILHSEKLNNGMYILKINRGNEMTSKKIIR